MNTKPQLIASILSCIVLMSCNKDESSCINGDMNPIEPGTYEYSWCGPEVDKLEWQLWDGSVETGESVALTFDSKDEFSITVEATYGRKKKKESYNFQVGEYQARIEPMNCNYQRLSSDNYTAYLYDSYDNLKTDLGYVTSFYHVAAKPLRMSKYYNGAWNATAGAVSGFTDVESGNYIIYIVNTETGDNNLIDIIQGATSTIEVNNGKEDDIAKPFVNVNSNGNEHLKNLIGETFTMTNSWINSVNEGVPVCNMDDKITFDIDGTFTHHVGADDCAGSQTASTGMFVFPSSCTDLSNESISLEADSGSWDGQTISLEFTLPTKFKIGMTVGQDYVEQEYSVQ